MNLRPLFFAVGVCSVFLTAPTVHALEDPTRPPGASSAGSDKVRPAPQLDLNSVVIGRDRRTAVINGELRSVGDVFEGARVRSIGPEGVELVENGEVRILRLEALPEIRSVQ